ncbi:hypothetical protein DB32_003110 [Sandaracinus amylolyticus]|uniref:Uncharacterized protein n=2 Tax=Sandaracinus amylolyticus TaxID=927083 RepID=A0A0F6W2S5_9BACT|nr:hypothetical protein DB32_003110 [Sandaracinus amylolyticus]
MLIHPQYEAFYGSIARVGKGSVQTLFYQFLGFPLLPQGTYWVEGSALTSWSDLRVTELRRDWRSIGVGYLRGWSTSLAVWLLGIGILFAFLPGQAMFAGDPMPFGRSVAVPIAIVLGVLALFAAIVIWIATRFPVSGDELARRAIYQRFLGTAIDPALLDNPWSPRDDLKRAMANVAEQLGIGRSTQTFDRWSEIALRPDLALPDFLRMALTTARLCEASPEEGRDAASYRMVQDAIWSRLVAIDPSARSARPS